MLSRTFSIAIIEENVCKNIGDELSYRCLYLERSDHPLPPLFLCSIGSILGCRAEILQLDVTDVKMDCFLTE